jgi:ribosomal protein S18 acetylase RimI-like enzyme
MSDIVAHLREQDDDGAGLWDLRRDDALVGTARTRRRRRGQALAGLDVPIDDASAALSAVGAALRDAGQETMVVDVPTGDEVLTAALAGHDTGLVATQMLLDLTRPVSAPDRVVLRPMTQDEFAGYREHLVAAYAQEMLDAGAFDDLPAALTASEQSTQELLPEGPDTPGQHLWSGVDGDTVVGVLWIHVEAARGYIYDIEVREDQRRRGYGRELLDAGALVAVDLGAKTLGLNVFGHNDGARALYERAGYDTTEQTFRVVLSADRDAH